MIDESKQYRTRDGLDVRIYAVDAGGQYPVHAAILKPDAVGDWAISTWTLAGAKLSGGAPNDGDLVEVKAEVWIWQFMDGSVSEDNSISREECCRLNARTSGQAVRFVQEDEA
jgi:hypothetical protein